MVPHRFEKGDAMRRTLAVLVATVCVTAWAGIAAAQSGGAVSGVVRDTSGGVLPGATVVLTNVDRQQRRWAGTAPARPYHFLLLPAGGSTTRPTHAALRRPS